MNKINKKIILGILVITLIMTLPVSFATDNQTEIEILSTDNLIPIVEQNYTAEELELIHQREIDYENALNNSSDELSEIENTSDLTSNIITPKFNDIKINVFNAENITITTVERPFENITAQVTTLNNTTVNNLQISLKITRSSNGVNKIYNLTTDENGTINLPINLADGTYKVETYYKDYYKYNEHYKLSSNDFIVENNTKKYFHYFTAGGFNPTYIRYQKDINMTYGEDENYTFQILTLAPSRLNQKFDIKVEFTRLSDNAKKQYYYYSDISDIINIPINLAPGAYHVYVGVYIQNTYYKLSTNRILVSNPLVNTIETLLINDDDKSNYYVGALRTYSGDNLSFKNVDINITRKSDNMSKVYSVLTNEDGYYSLPINLGHGEYTVKCSYNGTDTYSSCQSLENINC